MPPTLFGSSQAHRFGGNVRQRDNSSQNAAASSSRRRKSRSPSSRPCEDQPLSRNGSFIARKARKPVPNAAITTNEVQTRASICGEGFSTADRRQKARPARPQTMFVDEDNNMPAHRGRIAGLGRNRRKEKSRSRSRSIEASHHVLRKTASPEPMDDDSEPQRSNFSGPLAVADFSRMRHEIEVLKREKTTSKKTITKQSKLIDELRKELTNLRKSENEKAKEVENMRKQAKKVDDVVANLEASLTCPICTDVLAKPHGLSPCGHVLCQGCLQEWFRSAPVDDDGMYDDEAPPALIFRKKTCPSCRTVVRNRPIPLFIVKSVIADLEKAKAPANAQRRPSPPREDEGDPWAGIFPDDANGEWFVNAHYEDDEDYDEDADDYDDDDDDDDDDEWSYDGYGTAEDEDRYEGMYVHPHWKPPHVTVEDDQLGFMDDMDINDMRMLRRGATLHMIDLFHMSYTHEEGISAIYDGATIFLGWNIELHPEDDSGEDYMDWVARDMVQRSERWETLVDIHGNKTVRRLVPEEDEEDYDTTDSEAWVGEPMSD